MTRTIGVATGPAQPIVFQPGSLNQFAVRGTPWSVAGSGGVWVRRMGAYAQSYNNRFSNMRFCAWAMDPASFAPARLLTASAEFTLPLGGGFVEADVTPFGLAPGSFFCPGLLATAGAGIVLWAHPGGASQAGWSRANPWGYPFDPYGAADWAGGVPAPVIYAVVEDNRAGTLTPTTPDGAIVPNGTPTLTAAFSDPDSVYGDRINWLDVEVRAAGTTALLHQWSGGQGSNDIAWTYNGPALSAGASYEWRMRGYDVLGLPSEWSEWRGFTVAEAGVVDYSNAIPSGKVPSGVVPQFSARWTHPQGQAMTHAQVRVLDAGTWAVLAESGQVAKPTPDGGTFLLSNAEAGFATAAAPLAPGDYVFQARGRDALGNWGAYPAGSGRFFSVNSPPNVPAALTPHNGAVVGGPPRLEWLLVDPDLDDVVGVGVVADLELTRPNGSLVSREVADVDPATGRMFYQATATDVPEPLTGRYEWRVRGRELATGLVSPAWGGPNVFDYAPAPRVTITAPASEGATVTTSAPVVRWTVEHGPMVAYRVNLYRGWVEPETAFFSSGQIALPTAQMVGAYQIPAGWLGNGRDYRLEIEAWTAADQVGVSPRRYFTVAYPSAADLVAVTVSLFARRRDQEATAVLISWGATGLPPARFAGYVVWRRLATEEPWQAAPIVHLPAANQTAWSDFWAPPNRQLIYAVTQMERVGADVRASAPVEGSILLPVTTPTLTAVSDGWNRHAAVMWLGAGIGGGFARPANTYTTWGGEGKPVLVSAPRRFGQASFDLGFTLRDDHRGKEYEHFADWQALVEDGGELFLRTEEETAWVRIAGPVKWWTRGADNGTRDVTLQLEEIAFSEAVNVPT